MVDKRLDAQRVERASTELKGGCTRVAAVAIAHSQHKGVRPAGRHRLEQAHVAQVTQAKVRAIATAVMHKERRSRHPLQMEGLPRWLLGRKLLLTLSQFDHSIVIHAPREITAHHDRHRRAADARVRLRRHARRPIVPSIVVGVKMRAHADSPIMMPHSAATRYGTNNLLLEGVSCL